MGDESSGAFKCPGCHKCTNLMNGSGWRERFKAVVPNLLEVWTPKGV